MVESGRACVHTSDSSGMAINQLIIVRRGCEDRYRSLQDTFGVEPLSATVVWDRRQRDQRVCAHAAGTDRRRTDRRPSSWSALDFLVAGANSGAATRRSTRPVDGDVLLLREVSANGPCSVSTVPGPAHVLLPSYPEAAAYAFRLVGTIPVDVWYTEDHMTFTTVRRARRDAVLD